MTTPSPFVPRYDVALSRTWRLHLHLGRDRGLVTCDVALGPLELHRYAELPRDYPCDDADDVSLH
jgi:hypothetical protein